MKAPLILGETEDTYLLENGREILKTKYNDIWNVPKQPFDKKFTHQQLDPRQIPGVVKQKPRR